MAGVFEFILASQAMILDVATAFGTIGAAVVALKIANDGRNEARNTAVLADLKSDLLALSDAVHALSLATSLDAHMTSFAWRHLVLPRVSRAVELARLARSASRTEGVGQMTSWVLVLLLEHQTTVQRLYETPLTAADDDAARDRRALEILSDTSDFHRQSTKLREQLPRLKLKQQELREAAMLIQGGSRP